MSYSPFFLFLIFLPFPYYNLEPVCTTPSLLPLSESGPDSPSAATTKHRSLTLFSPHLSLATERRRCQIDHHRQPEGASHHLGAYAPAAFTGTTNECYQFHTAG